MAKAPKCENCDDDLSDWSGNVMVLNTEYSANKIDTVEVWCKDCSRLRAADHLHNVWELAWVRDRAVRALGHLLTEEPKRYTRKAKNTIYKLVAMAHPGLAREFIEGLG